MFKILMAPLLIIVSSTSTAALCGETLSDSTRQDLLAAMKNDAFWSLKYRMLAEQARKTGNQPLAGVLDHIATDEHEKHFREHAKLYGLVKIDHDSLVNAKAAESAESIQAYEDMANRAKVAGDANAAKHFSDLARDEVDHRDALNWASRNAAR